MTCFQVHCFFSFYLSKSVFEPSSEFFGSFIVFFTYSIFVWFLFFIVSISLLILSFCSYIFFLRFHLVVELCCLWALKNNYFDIFVGQFTDLHFFRVCYWRFIFFLRMCHTLLILQVPARLLPCLHIWRSSLYEPVLTERNLHWSVVLNIK